MVSTRSRPDLADLCIPPSAFPPIGDHFELWIRFGRQELYSTLLVRDHLRTRVEGASCFISKILNCHLTAKNRVNEILKKVLSCWTFFSPNITKSEPPGSFLRHLSFCRFNSDYPQLSAYNWQNTLQISTSIHNNGISSLLASFCNGIVFLWLGRLRKSSNSL